MKILEVNTLEIPSYIQLMQITLLFFLKGFRFNKKLFNTTSLFSLFPVLKPCLSKCKVAEIELLKGVNMVFCGITCIDLTKDAMKMLQIFFRRTKIFN